MSMAARPAPAAYPSAALAFRPLGRDGQIVSRYAASDRELFEDHRQPRRTRDRPPRRDERFPRSTTTATAEPCAWHATLNIRGTLSTSSRLEPGVEWVHVAPLLQRLPARDPRRAGRFKRRVSFDGQGLVRVPARRRDGGRRGLRPRAAAVALGAQAGGGRGGDRRRRTPSKPVHAARLGVPEILLTLGSEGAILYLGGGEDAIPGHWPGLRRAEHGRRRRLHGRLHRRPQRRRRS